MFGDQFWAIGNTSPSPSPALSPSPSTWSRIQDKLFERALVMFSEESPDRWQKIAAQVPGKTALEVWEHYEALVHDVLEIDSGRVQLPRYPDDSLEMSWRSAECLPSRISFGSKPKHAEAERKKGVPWSEEEHRLFLIGLHKYGKGDWRSISRMAVMSRTPTQVASHAQKYYLRLNSMKKERKRSSIHDITTVEDNPILSSSPNKQYMVAVPSVAPVQNAMQTLVVSTSLPIQASSSSGYQNQFGFPM